MRRLFYVAIGAVLTAGLLIGGYAAQAGTSNQDEGGTPEADQSQQQKPRRHQAGLAPQLGGLLGRALQGVPPGELFERFLGSEVRFLDEAGEPTTTSLTPGVVTAFTLAEDGTGSVTVLPNGEVDTVTHPIGADTRIHRVGGKDIQEGDKVILLVAGEELKLIYSSATTEVWPGQGGRFRPGSHGGVLGQRGLPSLQGRRLGPQPSLQGPGLTDRLPELRGEIQQRIGELRERQQSLFPRFGGEREAVQ